MSKTSIGSRDSQDQQNRLVRPFLISIETSRSLNTWIVSEHAVWLFSNSFALRTKVTSGDHLSIFTDSLRSLLEALVAWQNLNIQWSCPMYLPDPSFLWKEQLRDSLEEFLPTVNRGQVPYLRYPPFFPWRWTISKSAIINPDDWLGHWGYLIWHCPCSLSSDGWFFWTALQYQNVDGRNSPWWWMWGFQWDHVDYGLWRHQLKWGEKCRAVIRSNVFLESHRAILRDSTNLKARISLMITKEKALL